MWGNRDFSLFILIVWGILPINIILAACYAVGLTAKACQGRLEFGFTFSSKLGSNSGLVGDADWKADV